MVLFMFLQQEQAHYKHKKQIPQQQAVMLGVLMLLIGRHYEMVHHKLLVH